MGSKVKAVTILLTNGQSIQAQRLPPKRLEQKNHSQTHTPTQTYKLYNFRTKYWPANRRSTGGQTKEREKIESRNCQSVLCHLFSQNQLNLNSWIPLQLLLLPPLYPQYLGNDLNMTLENSMGPGLPKGQSQYVHISETCARVAVPAAQHMMCQLLYIGWVRKRLIKDKLSPCNISASLSSLTEKKEKMLV